MAKRNRLAEGVGLVAGVAALAMGGVAVGLELERRVISKRIDRNTDAEVAELFSLHTAKVPVTTPDGVVLHAEIEPGEATDLTVVFVHGYALNMDCWHFQRKHLRGKVRQVFYDQRSHGRSGRSDREHSTAEQLGLDLRRVIDAAAPDGPVVLVGHSMGGMSIISMVEQFPELIGNRVVGVGLISTTAGGLDVSRMLLPMLPARLSGPFTHRAVRTLHRGHRVVDGVRRLGRAVATVATDRYAFGSDVPEAYVEFTDEMLSATPFEVIGDFFPLFSGLDKFHAVEALGAVPTSVICGTSDKLTSIGHSRKLHDRIPGSRLLECDGAGHLVMIERHDLVSSELDQLITAATGARSR
jgi:pimeloyl-ACP methyl ester carboxylesterase